VDRVDLCSSVGGVAIGKVEETMNNKMQPVLLLGGGLLILAIWRNPAVAAQDVGDVLGNVWEFLQLVLSKVAEFLGNLG
jgi:hypothetical protein